MRRLSHGAGTKAHHQITIDRSDLLSGADSQPRNVHAPGRVPNPQLALVLDPPMPRASSPRRTRASRIASFMSSFFEDDPAIRTTLERVAAAEIRRCRMRGGRAG